MKRNLITVLLVMIVLLCCGCAAANDTAQQEMRDISAQDVQDDGAYGMDRSAASAETEVSQEAAAVAAVEPLVYVSYSQHSGAVNAEDGTKLFISQYQIPEFVSEDESLNVWMASAVESAANETALAIEEVARYAQSVYQNSAGEDFYPYSFYSNVSSARLDNMVISFLQLNSVYSGGAHPNYAQKAYNLDLESRIELTLSDVLLPGGAEVLCQQVLSQLAERFGSLEHSGLYSDYQDVVKACFEDTELTSNWYFSENGLVVYFNCYDIAPYAAGIIKVEIPCDMLEGVLKPDYFPANGADGTGDITVIDSPDGYKVLGGSAEGECIFVVTDQIVYDIKLHRLTGWLTDDVPVVGSMVLAANRLTADEAVAVPVVDDPGCLLTYRDGAGIVKQMVITTSGIREIVNEIAE